MASSAENVLLQGFAVTGAAAGEQLLVTQGYGGAAAPQVFYRTRSRRNVVRSEERQERFRERRRVVRSEEQLE